jgi:protein-S-isoprenylcysteine O-methyltransferase Ste14
MVNFFKLLAFLIGTGLLIYISRASLLKPHSHGFYRFFAWECMAALFLVNVNFWIRNPFSFHQIISWILLFGCLIPLGFGITHLTGKGKPAENRSGEPQLLAFEKTTQLVTTGIYHYIRHPLYSSLLWFTWGICFKQLSWLSLLLAILASILLYFTARADEAECIQYFGNLYNDYMKNTKRFLPFVF